MSPFLNSIESHLWSDIDQAAVYPAKRPTLAHYTSLATMERILINKELWLSHPLLMNDDQEMRWGLVEGHRQFVSHEGLRKACESADRQAALIGTFEAYYNRFVVTHAYDIYVACFCEHTVDTPDGLLSMWRAYGANGGGAAIVVGTDHFVPQDSRPLILAPVEYAPTSKREKWITQHLDYLASQIAAHRPSLEDLKLAAHTFCERLKLFALFTKHHGFSEEREWRLVYMPDRDGEGHYREMLSYAVTDRGVQPKLKLRLDQPPSAQVIDFSLNKLVRQILLGPVAGSPLSTMAVKRILDAAGLPGLREAITVCSTPYRA